METLIKTIIKLVHRDELNVANRKREIIHKKFYLYYLLRSKKVKFYHIAKLFNAHHSSIVYGTNQYKHLISINDDILQEDILEYKQMNLEELVIEEGYMNDEFIKSKMEYYSMKYDLKHMQKLLDGIMRKYDNKLYKEFK